MLKRGGGVAESGISKGTVIIPFAPRSVMLLSTLSAS